MSMTASQLVTYAIIQKKQLAAILFTSEKKITIIFHAVQIQTGGSDCGLFTLAFATSLCAGENPAEVHYIQHSLRDHLLSCLQSRVMTNFPTRNRRRRARIRGKESYEVYCICKLPECGQMICCNSCMEWFHDDCVKVPKATWKKDSHWFCQSCSR